MKKGFKKIYIVSLFFAGFFIALTIFLIIPLVKGIEKDSRDLITVKGDRDFFSEEKKNIEKFEDVFKEIEPSLQKIDGFFVSSEVPIEFMSFLEKLALESNVSVKNPSVNLVESNKSSWPFLNFNLEVSGSFSSFSRFVEKLENSSYLIQVQNLNIKKINSDFSSSSQKGLSDTINASFILKVFAK
jgi:hypothetical protein